MDRKPQILGVAEVVLNVIDIPKMQAFYEEVLGFSFHSEMSMESHEPDPCGEPTICFLRIAESNSPLGLNGHPPLLALIDVRRHVFAKRFLGHDVLRSTLNHVAFEIPPDHFQINLERLERLGIETTVVDFSTLHAHAIFFIDPEGNQLELIAYRGGDVR